MIQIRFLISGAPVSEWEEETVRYGAGEHTAVRRLTELRMQYPNEPISIERRGDLPIRTSEKKMRFRIQDGQEIHYSRALTESEQESALNEIRKMFPEAEVKLWQ